MNKKSVWFGIIVLIGILLIYNVGAYSCSCATGSSYSPNADGINVCMGVDVISSANDQYIPICYGNIIDPYNIDYNTGMPISSYGSLSCGEAAACIDCQCDNNPNYVSPQQNCVDKKGISCDNNVCIFQNDKSTDNLECTLSTPVHVSIDKTSLISYYFKSLTIKPGVTLSFTTSVTSGTGGGISKGAPASTDGPGSSPGGAGGNGGAMFNKGTSGTGNHPRCTACQVYCWDKYGGAGGDAGAKIYLEAKEKIVNNGIISVDGQKGANGVQGEGECDAGWLNGGRNGEVGTGGGGGGGAGELTIKTLVLEGTTGIFSAKGGNNGYGGVGGTKKTSGGVYSCSCNHCDYSHGAAGAYGGAGDGGKIIINANKVDSHFDKTQTSSYLISGGKQICHGVPDGTEYSGQEDERCGFNEYPCDVPTVDGKPGNFDVSSIKATEQSDISGNSIPNACNDEKDNDADGFIDMFDSDCYPGSTIADGCPSSNTNSFNGWTPTIKSTVGMYPSAKDGTDGCCGDDWINKTAIIDNLLYPEYLGDYGFIHYINGRTQYMCYDSIKDLSSPISNPGWLNAPEPSNNYRIKTIKVANGSVDVVSNAQDWYYCNATGNSALQGIPIAEGQTFINKNVNNQYTCADLATRYFVSASSPKTFVDGCKFASNGLREDNCCNLNGALGTPMLKEDVSSCECYVKGDPNTYFFQSESIKTTALSEYVDTDVCSSNTAECAKLISITTNGDWQNSNLMIDNYTFANMVLNRLTVSNSSFICFKENYSLDIISQCCYGSNCNNKDYTPRTPNSPIISDYSTRVLTRGASIHTIDNFDTFATSNAGIVRQSRRGYLNANGLHIPYVYSSNKFAFNLNLSMYDTLEFDMLYNSQNKDFLQNLNITINGDYGGKKYRFSTQTTNGNKSLIFHHIILPITPDTTGTTSGLFSITFDDYSNKYASIILDNIILTSNGKYATKTYYCTGGFSTWIDELDLQAPTTNAAIYGPNMFACMGTPSYSWTGTYCCGDDTTLMNKEYYNDVQGGCFEGSKLVNASVASVKGYNESTSKQYDELASYNYSNILYYDNKFLGCQVEGNNANLKKYNLFGSDNVFGNNNDLITSNNYVYNQCKVVGTYYCKDGVWRQKIDLVKDFNSKTDIDKPFVSTKTLTLKTTPAGVDLIQNGFRS